MRVSIILPTYNRLQFLPQALSAIGRQSYTNWELIIVDDGSTDGSKDYLNSYIQQHSLPITYLYQQNGGPAKARNAGIAAAQGDLFAFFDSDDYWDDEHLELAVTTLTKHSQLDWLYFACRRIDKDSAKVILDSTFYTDEQPNPLFTCASLINEDTYQLDNQLAALCQLHDGIDSGLQNSVIRRRVIDAIPIPDFRIGEDRLFILQALKHPFTLGFVDKVTVNYIVHQGNTSDTNVNETNADKRINAMRQLLQSYLQTPKYVVLNREEQKALNQRLAQDYFWKLGYALEAQTGRYKQAIESMQIGIKYDSSNWKFYKTLLATYLKYWFA